MRKIYIKDRISSRGVTANQSLCYAGADGLTGAVVRESDGDCGGIFNELDIINGVVTSYNTKVTSTEIQLFVSL